MRCNLIFKGIHEKENEGWEDISMVLAKLINEKIDLPYPFEEIDKQISRAHRGSGSDEQEKLGLSSKIILGKNSLSMTVGYEPSSRVQMHSLNGSLHLQISHLVRARSSLTFRQLSNAYVTWQEHTVSLMGPIDKVQEIITVLGILRPQNGYFYTVYKIYLNLLRNYIFYLQ